MTIYIATDVNDNNRVVTASTSKTVCAWGIVEYLERSYTAEEWEDFLAEDNYLSNEDMVRNIVAGMDDALNKFKMGLLAIEDKSEGA